MVTHYPRFKATSKETRQPTALRGAKQPTLSQPTWLGSTCTAALLHGQTVPAGTLQAHPKSATTKLLAAAQSSALRRGLRKVRLCKRKRAIQWPIAAGGRSSALGALQWEVLSPRGSPHRKRAFQSRKTNVFYRKPVFSILKRAFSILESQHDEG